jgi:low affinity Fe/Cu permease
MQKQATARNMAHADGFFHPRNNIAVFWPKGTRQKSVLGGTGKTILGLRVHHKLHRSCGSGGNSMAENQQDNRLGNHFHLFATKAAYVVGTKWAFFTSLLIIVAWAVVGPTFHYSNTWQLVINTATTIVTFLMVFLIQNTQNRDARAIHLKLDEIIHSIRKASNDMISIENLSDKELESLAKNYEKIRAEYETRRAHHKVTVDQIAPSKQ